jgi:putative IMPACT (imprinted ancient) family translation regulator
MEKVTLARLVAAGPYSYVTPVARLLPDFEARIADQAFAADVTWEIVAPEERIGALKSALVELSRGEIVVTPRTKEPD